MSQKRKPAQRPHSDRPARAFSLQVRQVAQKFLCSCGTCDVPELADCVCPTAIKEKDLIDRELRNGRPAADVVRLVDERYGKLKLQFASVIGGPSKAPPQASADPGVVRPGLLGSPAAETHARAPTPGGSDGLASEVDAALIASKFICACGTCQDHVLSECNCSHPRGGREMKAFIDYKITQKQYSAVEIADAVAYEYGHLRQAH